MTQRQRAIEDFISATIEKWKDDRRNERYYPLHVAITDALLASGFCSDPVRELIVSMNKFCDEAFHGWPEQFFIDPNKRELLRKIVED